MKTLGPLQISEIILHTMQFDAMRTWYRRLFDDLEPATSFYYRAPDDNLVELSAVNIATEKKYLAFFRSGEFRRNIEGHPVNAEDYRRAGRSSEAGLTPWPVPPPTAKGPR